MASAGGDLVPMNIQARNNIENPTTKAEISWDKPNNEPLYYLVEAFNGQVCEQTSHVKGTQHTMSQLKPGTKYSFKVYAVYKNTEAMEEKGSSGCLTNMITTRAAPAKIKKLSIIIDEENPSTSAIMIWESVDEDGESDQQYSAKKFQISLVCINKKHFYQEMLTEDKQFQLNGLEPGYTYEVTVTGGNDQGFGEKSDPKQFTTDLGIPHEVRLMVDKDLPSSSVILRFANAEGMPVGYLVTLYKGEFVVNEKRLLRSPEGYFVRFKDKEIGGNTEYHAEVQALYYIENESRSGVIVKSNIVVTAPPKPQPPHVELIRENDKYKSGWIKITWDPPKRCHIHEVEIRKEGSEVENTLVVEQKFCKYQCKEEGNKYRVRMRSQNPSGYYGEWSEYAQVQLAPADLQHVKAVAEDDEIVVKWAKPQLVTEFTVQVYVDGDPYGEPVERRECRYAVAMNPDTPSSTYSFAVCAKINELQGNMVKSNDVISKPLPGLLTNIASAESGSSTEVVISWKKHSKCDFYLVEIKRKILNQPENILIIESEDAKSGDEQSCTYICQSPGDIYAFRVRCHYCELFGDWSEIKLFQLESPKLELVAFDGYSARSRWQKPKRGNVLYNIYCHYGDSKVDQIFESKIEEITLTNLKQGCYYYVFVEAVSQIGEETQKSQSNLLKFSTAPLAPTNLQAQVFSDNRVTVSFDDPDQVQKEYEITFHDIKHNVEFTERTKKQLLCKHLNSGELYVISVRAITQNDASQKTQKELYSLKTVTRVWTYPESTENVIHKKLNSNHCIEWKTVCGADSYEIKWTHDSHSNSHILTENSFTLMNLSLGSVYSVSVAAINKAGKGQFSRAIQFATDPPMPTDTTVKHYKDSPCTSLMVSFKNVMATASYIITAECTSQPGTECEETDFNVGLLKGLIPGETYKIYVRAKHEGLVSRKSYFHEFIQTYPPKLSKPEVKEKTGVNITISWQKPSCDILSYHVLWKYIDENGESSSKQTEISMFSEYTLQHLIPGCKYAIAIAAVNTSGRGLYSEELAFNAAPLPPCNVEICKVTETSISVKFCHKDPEQQRFLVDLTCLSDDQNSEGVRRNIEGCFAFINDLIPGEAYNLMIYAICGEMKSSPTKSITVNTYPEKVRNICAKQSTCNSQSISWNRVGGATFYSIIWKEEGRNYQSTSTQHTNIELQNLELGQRYTVSVAAVNNAGHGQYSDPVDFTTAPLAPTNLQVQLFHDNAVKITFEDPDPREKEYEVIYSNRNGLDKRITREHFLYVQLDPGQLYEFYVRAITPRDNRQGIHDDMKAGKSNNQTPKEEIRHENSDEEKIPESSAQNIKLCTSSPPARKQKLYSVKSVSKELWTYCSRIKRVQCNRLSKSSWVISWNEVHGATDYAVKYESNDSCQEETKVSDTETILKDLKLGKIYSVAVAAINSAGQGKESRPGYFKTDLAPPESVIVTNVKNQPESSIHVQIMEHETKPAIYKITMEAVTSADTFEKIISRNTACINDLKPGTQYIAHVCSYDEGDKDRISKITSSEPIWTYPSQVQDLAVAIVNTTSCKISWKPVKGATLYEIKWKKSTDKKYKVQDTGTVTEISLVHLDLNTFYSALVTAVNSAGHGKPSTVTTFQTGLHPPSNLQVKNSELDKQTSIDVEFTEPEQRANKYGIRVVQKEGKFKDITHETGYNWATISGLNSGECYRVYVYSIHDKDKKLNSSEISSELIRTALGRIKLTTTKVSATRQKLEWSGQPSAKQYLVKWGIENSESKEFSTKEPDCILENLSPGQTYVASAAAVNDTGIGEESEIIKFTTVPSTPQNLQYKLISTDVTTLTFDSCHGATNYKVKISSAEDGSQIDEEMTTLPQYRFKYQGSCVKFQVEIEAQNSAGSSKPSKALEFKQILRHLHVKSSKQAMHDQPQQSFIPPLIRKIPSGQSEVFEDFIRPDPGEVVLLVGDQFYGKSASCAYYIQRYQTENLVVMMDYDKVRDSTQKMDIQTLLHKYMTDLTTAEMDITFQWMKENSKQVSFVIDNASFPKDFHEKQCSYEDKEDVSVLLYNITRRHRDIFPESQIFCTTSQDSIQGIMKPSRAATIVGFKENHLRQMQKQIFNDKDVPDMPFHVQELCAIPSFCKIIIQLYANNTANIDLSSVSAVLAEVLLRILSSNSDDVNKAKLSQLYNRMNEFSDKIDIKRISHGKVKLVKGKRARKLEGIDETASSVYTQMTEREDDYTDIVGETYVKALYTAIAMGASEFEQFFNNKGKLDISRHSKLWIMAAGLFRSDTLEKISRVFSPVFPIIAKNAEKKKGILKKFITGNMVSIQSQVYQNHDITLAWLMCCAEMQDETLQRKCFAEIKIKNDMSLTAVQQVSTFLENLPMVICRMVKLKIKHNIKPAINAEIDAALRHNPYGKIIARGSYSSAFSRVNESKLQSGTARSIKQKQPVYATKLHSSDTFKPYGTSGSTISERSEESITFLHDAKIGILDEEPPEGYVPCTSDDASNCSDLTKISLHVKILGPFEVYELVAQSLTDGTHLQADISERNGIIRNINPGDKYKIQVFQKSGDSFVELISETTFQTDKIVGEAGGHVTIAGCSVSIPPGALISDTKMHISYSQDVPLLPEGYIPIGSVNVFSSAEFQKAVKCDLVTWCRAIGEPVEVFIFFQEDGKWCQGEKTKLTENGKVYFTRRHSGKILPAVFKRDAHKIVYQLHSFLYYSASDAFKLGICPRSYYLKNKCLNHSVNTDYQLSPLGVQMLDMGFDEEINFSLKCDSTQRDIVVWKFKLDEKFLHHADHSQVLQVKEIIDQEKNERIKLTFVSNDGKLGEKRTTFNLAYPLHVKVKAPTPRCKDTSILNIQQQPSLTAKSTAKIITEDFPLFQLKNQRVFCTK